MLSRGEHVFSPGLKYSQFGLKYYTYSFVIFQKRCQFFWVGQSINNNTILWNLYMANTTCLMFKLVLYKFYHLVEQNSLSQFISDNLYRFTIYMYNNTLFNLPSYICPFLSEITPSMNSDFACTVSVKRSECL